MRFLLKLFGWTVVGEPLKDDKVIVIFAPHTSNWDFVLAFMARFCFEMNIAYLAKHTLFNSYFGWFFRSLGGMPVERSSPHNMVEQVVSLISARDKVVLGMAPEGTRGKTAYWKSGFYHIALKAEVPLVLAYLDTQTKEVGLGLRYELTGDLDQDMKVIKEFYQDKVGIKPGLTSEVKLEDLS